jgi:hypothetical protein
MTVKRAAIYGGLGTLVAAYLAAANSSPLQNTDAARERSARATATSGTQTIVSEVQAQAARLRTRMQQAPVPDRNPRNPFAFAEVAPKPRAAEVVHATVADSPAVAPAPPPLTLMGMAEDETPQGVRRTAVISGAADAVYMVTEGETLIGRYRVAKIGADAIELDDLVTHGVRRLAMR